MMHDDFENWIIEQSRGCLSDEERSELFKAELDFDSGEYIYENQSVQGQWEAWQAALKVNINEKE